MIPTIPDSIHLESIAIKFYPKIIQFLETCNHLNNINKSSNRCLYLKLLIGDNLFNLLYQQFSNSNEGLLFQCKLYVKNVGLNLTQIESSINSDTVNLITETHIMAQNSKFISVENVSLSTSTFDSSKDIEPTSIETISSANVSLEQTLSPTISSDSNSVQTKDEEFSALSKDQKDLNESNSISNTSNSTKVEEIAKNMTQNEMSLQSGQTVVNGNSHLSGSSVTPQSKESVVLRLSNRIKALEVNLSLSSQYLEELSLRYRKQMEEMQRAFNITISKLNDTASRAAERVTILSIYLYNYYIIYN